MRRLTLLFAAVLAFVLLGASSASAQSVQLAPFGGQSFNSPYYVTSPPGDASRVMVVQGTGSIRLVKDGATQPGSFLNISADVLDGNEGGCECGLFSIAFAPDYASSGLFYVFYTRDANPGLHYLRIEEFRRSASNPDVADPGSRRIVLEIPHLSADNHNGGQLQFGPDKLLYIATGDGGNTPGNGQSLGTQLGKILRIDPRGSAPFSYTVPADNPFRDGPGGAADEIYSSGLRNPYRFSFDRSTGNLTIGDVGGSSWEEIDFAPEGAGRGANFGWNCFEGAHVNGGCPVPNHTPPALEYPNGGSGAAVSGGYVIRDSALPGLHGRYVYADTFNALGDQIRSAVLGSGAPNDSPLGLTADGVSSFGQDACGHIYVARLNGAVSRLQPTSGPFPCKLAPALVVETKSARRAARKGAVVIKALCDEDCDLSAKVFITLKGRAKGGGASSAKRGRKKRPVIPAVPVNVRLQLGQKARLRFDLSKKRTKRLRKALARGRKAVAKIEVSATGGGGGTATVKRRVRQRR
jgi:glucose/arabinose dehydrogenase